MLLHLFDCLIQPFFLFLLSFPVSRLVVAAYPPHTALVFGHGSIRHQHDPFIQLLGSQFYKPFLALFILRCIFFPIDLKTLSPSQRNIPHKHHLLVVGYDHVFIFLQFIGIFSIQPGNPVIISDGHKPNLVLVAKAHIRVGFFHLLQGISVKILFLHIVLINDIFYHVSHFFLQGKTAFFHDFFNTLSLCQLHKIYIHRGTVFQIGAKGFLHGQGPGKNTDGHKQHQTDHCDRHYRCIDLVSKLSQHKTVHTPVINATDTCKNAEQQPGQGPEHKKCSDTPHHYRHKNLIRYIHVKHTDRYHPVSSPQQPCCHQKDNGANPRILHFHPLIFPICLDQLYQTTAADVDGIKDHYQHIHNGKITTSLQASRT